MRKVKEVFRVNPRRFVEGDLGVEIEVEGENLPTPSYFWRREHDGSLRGPETAEYVLKKPLALSGVQKALAHLQRCYKANDTRVIDSVRAGVHVHVNVQELNVVELYNFMTLYLVLEEVLVSFCGPHREGNLFCLRACDADFLLEALKSAARRRRFSTLYSDDLRYASMNVKSLHQYGSLEFRAMRGTEDFQAIYDWSSILLTLREAAKQFEDPREVVAGFSGMGAEHFVDQILGGLSPLLKGVANFEKLVFNGMRNAQDIAYCTNWNTFRERPVKVNPFAAAKPDGEAVWW